MISKKAQRCSKDWANFKWGDEDEEEDKEDRDDDDVRDEPDDEEDEREEEEDGELLLPLFAVKAIILLH